MSIANCPRISRQCKHPKQTPNILVDHICISLLYSVKLNQILIESDVHYKLAFPPMFQIDGHFTPNMEPLVYILDDTHRVLVKLNLTFFKTTNSCKEIQKLKWCELAVCACKPSRYIVWYLRINCIQHM